MSEPLESHSQLIFPPKKIRKVIIKKPKIETIENIKSEKIKPFQKQDLHYLKNSEIAFSKILSFGDRKIFFRNITQNYPSMDIKDVHNKLGIIHFSRDCVRIALGLSVLVPAWHSKIKA